MLKRNRPYHSKKQIINCINKDEYYISKKARETAFRDFGWDVEDIINALKKLDIKKHYHKTVPRFENPKIMEDYYKARNLNGENVYIHLHINENRKLIISSFKEI